MNSLFQMYFGVVSPLLKLSKSKLGFTGKLDIMETLMEKLMVKLVHYAATLTEKLH